MNILYIIPARGGSKGLPGKNIRLLHGIPLIAYSIKAALDTKNKGTVMVTTDDDTIAAIAEQYGAAIPFIRPAHLSDDAASTTDVILHTLDFYEKSGKQFDYLVLLQPTSPIRLADDIDAAFTLLKNENAKAVVSVCEAEHHPLWANVLPENGCMKDFIREDIKGKNRQQLPVYYRLNGSIYISSVETFRSNKTFIHAHTIAYKMPLERSVDIDHEIDFMLAGLLLKSKN
jgi:CMP-N,N'-diacetyllegionaminic acid synthase